MYVMTLQRRRSPSRRSVALSRQLELTIDHGVRASSVLAGTCWTQLTDTLQETNGLLTADRQPKAPASEIRAAVTGRG